MKYKKLIILFPLLLSNTLKTNFDYSKYEFLKLYIKDGENSFIDNHYEIDFGTSKGYLFEFKNNKNENLESVLIEGNYKDYEVLCIYDYEYKFNYESINAFLESFKSKENDIVLANSYYDYNGDDYPDFRIENNGIQYNSTNYFKINDLEDKFYRYSSSYLNETSLLNVPNYMNTMYDGYGCIPTSIAIYFAYLEDNGYSILANYNNLPVSHSEDIEKVNSFIKYIGNLYLDSTDTGTYRTAVQPGFNKYLDDHKYGQYECEVSKNYDEYRNSISNFGLPVSISMKYSGTTYYHNLVGIGFREIFNGTNTETFIVANEVDKYKETTLIFNTNCVRQFYFIHK